MQSGMGWSGAYTFGELRYIRRAKGGRGFESSTVVSAQLLFFLLRLFGKRLLDRLARQHLVAHGCVINETGDDDRRLFQVVRQQAVINVHVGMMSARFILNRVLNKLESRNANCVE